MSEQILSQEYTEVLRVLPQDTKTSKFIAEKVKDIVRSLLHKYEHQYNIDDFNFVVCDDKEPNAFYISDRNTDNGKHVIGVTIGMIDFCFNEDEFAGVIGHELGHFIYDRLLKGKNSILQERGADLHTMDLMLEGGYDPVAYERVCRGLESKNTGLYFGDIHGSPYSRTEDVRAYLTYLKKEKGDFPQPKFLRDGKWNVIKKDLASISKDDKFYTYLEHKMLEHFGTTEPKDDYETCKFLFAEYKSGNITVMQHRIKEFKKFIINKMQKKFDSKTLELVYEFLEWLIQNPEFDADMFSILAGKAPKGKLKHFGVYKVYADLMDKFINAETKDEAKKYSQEMRRMRNYQFRENIMNCFDWPKFKMPKESEALGQYMPNAKLLQWAKEDKDIDYDLVREIKIECDYNYLFDRNRKIIIVGKEEVDEYFRKKREEEYRETFEKVLKGMLTALRILSDYNDKKITAQEAVKQTQELLTEGVVYSVLWSHVSKSFGRMDQKVKERVVSELQSIPLLKDIKIQINNDEPYLSYKDRIKEVLKRMFFELKDIQHCYELNEVLQLDYATKLEILRMTPKDYLDGVIRHIGLTIDMVSLLNKNPTAIPELVKTYLEIVFRHFDVKILDTKKFDKSELDRMSGISDNYYLYMITVFRNDIIVDLQTLMSNEFIYALSTFDLKKELGAYLKRNPQIIKNCDYKDLLNFYVRYEQRGAFSEEHDTQETVLDVLIERINNMSPAEQEKESWKLLCGEYDKEHREAKEFKYPLQKNRLMEIYTNCVVARLGKDNESTEYYRKIEDLIKYLSADTKGRFPRKLLSDNTKNKLFRILSDKIVSQEATSRLFKDSMANPVNSSDIEQGDVYGRVWEGLVTLLAQSPKTADETIKFLNRPLTDESKADFIKTINSSNLNFTNVGLLYNTFWTEGLEIRALIMNKLLNRIATDQNEEEKSKKQIKYVCDMHFAKDDPYRKDAELVFEKTIMAFDNFERSLILAAVASASNRKEDKTKKSSSGVGEGLRMFFENMGPAWVKFGQAVSYVPQLPSEIRKELSKLKDKADIPARWDLFEQIKNTLPNALQKNVVSVQEILGAGSFWVTAKIEYKDETTGEITQKVISLLRPYAQEKNKAGFRTIEKAVKDLAEQDKKYSVLLKVVQQASESAKHETDVAYGAVQLQKAKRLYGDLSVSIDGKIYTPNVANWEFYGTGKDKVGYKLMELAQGQTLNRVPASDDEKRKMALAYVTIELANLFKGDVWDIDRHMGQQNFEQTPQGNYNINIYDTGAQMQKGPNKKDMVLLAEVLYGLIRAARIGKPLDKQIMDTLDKLDTLENWFGVDTDYVSEVQKGLLALSDIIEYQKEIKDQYGNIIQESKSLSADDLASAIEAVYDSPTTNQTLKMSLAGKVLLNKLRPWRKGWISSLGEGISKSGKHAKLKIEKVESKDCTLSVLMNKPTAEIEKLNQEADETFGIKNKYIKKDNNEGIKVVASGIQRA